MHVKKEKVAAYLAEQRLLSGPVEAYLHHALAKSRRTEKIE